MYSKFIALEADKRERILNAALREFSQKGYKKASTNEIVKYAEISKGLLFHYFSTKKDLFLYLYTYFLDVFREEYYKKIDPVNKDVLLRIRQSSLLKLEMFKVYPLMFKFLYAASLEADGDVKDNLFQINTKLKIDSYAKAFTDVDISKFKDGVDIAKAVKLMMWALDGYSNDVAARYDLRAIDEETFKKIADEIDTYIDVLEQCFYK
jgi:TetR/AcrR family transcriptional regulator